MNLSIFIRLSLVLFLFATLSANAQERFYNQLVGQAIQANASFVVTDDKLSAPSWNYIEDLVTGVPSCGCYASNTQEVRNLIKFEIDHKDVSTTYLNWTESIEVDLQIETWEVDLNVVAPPSISNTPTNTRYVTLTVDYNNVLTESSPYAAIDLFEDAHIMRVTIQAVRTPNNPFINPNDYPPLRLSGETIISRSYHQFPQSTQFDVLINNAMVVDDMLRVYWNTSPYVTEYDFEWTFYDNESEIGKETQSGVGGNYNDFDFLFKNNTTRITTKQDHFNIPLLYRDGYLFYRYRWVYYDKYGTRKYTNWTSKLGSNSSTLKNFPEQFSTNWHESRINWQSSVVFAENGTNLPSIRYFDGSLRERQSVLKSNADQMTMASEIIYDHQGRAAVSVMPAPTFETKIRYNP
ncbi:MAG: hypothetical protein AAFP82_21275, partial [Bacteroidota bacterium]